MSKHTSIIIGFLCLVVVFSSTVTGAMLSGSELSIPSTGSTGTMDLILDQVPTGIAGYQLTMGFLDTGIVEFTSVNFPAAFNLNTASTLPSPTVSIVAVDLMDQIGIGAKNVVLAKVGIKGIVEGNTELKFSIEELTDDSGDPIQVTTNSPSIRVGSGSVTPTVPPTTSPTVPPSEPTIQPTATPTPGQVTPGPTVPPTESPTPEPAVPNVQSDPLQAEFTATPQSGTPPLTVKFTDLSAGNPKQWRWNFGDGTMSQNQSPTHVYGGLGRYTVTLEVISDNYTSITRKPEMIRVIGDYPTGPSGFVMVTSHPSGAIVNTTDRYSNEYYLGTTPASLIIPAGTHNLSYSVDGYQKKYIPVTIRPNEMKLIPKVTLKVIPE